ncbi:hypothetical protein XU18_4244 [Perkinsela sp. CCAP 1560/4]|nr:hypothetical protein XU18_4244 [Perkinsela sp. CCAP 1560/4]|eukprot:KNH04560.1 hypothetical protein XU18_4244 [Perkinsela sp. CCAP 1560/4]
MPKQAKFKTLRALLYMERCCMIHGRKAKLSVSVPASHFRDHQNFSSSLSALQATLFHTSAGASRHISSTYKTLHESQDFHCFTPVADSSESSPVVRPSQTRYALLFLPPAILTLLLENSSDFMMSLMLRCFHINLTTL